MFNLIRRAIDAERLERELEKAQSEIDALKVEAAYTLNAPSFREVAKSFDVSAIYPEIADRVIEDLAPFLTEFAIKLLKTAFAGLERDKSSFMSMRAEVAEETQSRTLHIRFVSEQMATNIYVCRPNGYFD